MNVSDILWASRSNFEAKPLLYVDDKPIASEYVADRMRKLAGGLRSRGIAKGDRVVIAMNNSAEWLITLFAVLRVGAVAVPVNPGLRSPEMCTIATHCEPSLAIVDVELVRHFDPLAGSFPTLVRGGTNVDEWEELVAAATSDRVAGRHGALGCRHDLLHFGNDRSAEGRRDKPRGGGLHRRDDRRAHADRAWRRQPRDGLAGVHLSARNQLPGIDEGRCERRSATPLSPQARQRRHPRAEGHRDDGRADHVRHVDEF